MNPAEEKEKKLSEGIQRNALTKGVFCVLFW